MDPLRDWHDYVDGLSRPVRRGMEDDADAARWRPWMEPSEPEPEEERVEPLEIPPLLASMGLPSHPGARHQVRPEYEDPTLNDTLKPIPEFEVPRLSAPGFEIAVPTLRRPGEKAAVETLDLPEIIPVDPVVPAVAAAISSADELENDAPGREGGEVVRPEPVGRDLDAIVPPNKRWELLEQIRAESGPLSGGRPRSRESREDLVQRLLDPTLTLEETALFLGVCPTTVRRYTNRGSLRHFRTQGNQRRFRLSDVVEFLENRSTEIEADAQADREAGRQ